jgi:Fic family protein
MLAAGAFADFFLRTCIDQVAFMASLMQPDRLRDRILIWAEEEIRAGALPPKSDTVLKAVLYQGQIGRDEVQAILGTSDRTARRVTPALLEAGALSSPSPRAPSGWPSRPNTRLGGCRGCFLISSDTSP